MAAILPADIYVSIGPLQHWRHKELSYRTIMKQRGIPNERLWYNALFANRVVATWVAIHAAWVTMRPQEALQGLPIWRPKLYPPSSGKDRKPKYK
jgi:hypothetical protein